MTLLVLTLLSVLSVLTVESVDPYYYPQYHLAPPKGWMNDPNGFCFFNGEYHLFYQYNPYSSQEPGIANWGHATSKDLIHWKHLDIALKPDRAYDISGVFSGSALVENNTMYLFYTGNVNHPGETPDHEQHQALAWSDDGVTFTKYENNPIIEGKNRQPNFRDPKVWKHKNTYYMVLGNSYNNDTLGRALLYSSKNLFDWEETSILDQSYGYMGYMWECPDFFELKKKFILLMSPQGIKTQGIDYRNLYQTGYFVGTFDYRFNKFTPETRFRVLDYGHDFYATQTIEDLNKNRVLEAWVDMWEQNYPERNAGFTGHMSLPRVLTLDDSLRLIQNPVFPFLRYAIPQIRSAVGNQLFSGRARAENVIELQNNTGLIEVTASGREDFSLILEIDGEPFVSFTYNYDIGLATLDRGGDDGKRSAKWRPKGPLKFRGFVDKSCIEIFLGCGEATFTSRIFPTGPMKVRVGESCEVEKLSVHAMKQTVPSPSSD